MLRFLLRLFSCQHVSTYRERRPLHGVAVMHLVCESCGRAVPAMDRTAGEHARALRTGAVRLPRAHGAATTRPAAVLSIRGGRTR